MSQFVSIVADKGTITTSAPITIIGGVGAGDWTFSQDLIGAGVLVTEDGQGFATAEQSPAAMAVDVTVGIAYVPDTAYTPASTRQKLYRVRSDAVESPAISSNPSGSTRYDFIVEDVNSSGTSDDTGSNLATTTVVEGVGGAGLPSLADDQTALALVTVPNGASTITDSDITDVRQHVGGGWVTPKHDFAFVSEDDPTYVMEVASNTAAATYYYAGMKVRLWQLTGGWKFFIVTKVAVGGSDTEITMYGGTDYNLENEDVLFVQISTEKAPKDFPLSPAKWTVTFTNAVTASQVDPLANTWYNLGSTSIDIPIGVWNVDWFTSFRSQRSSGATGVSKVTLSTGAATESDTGHTSGFRTSLSGSGTTSILIENGIEKSFVLDLAVEDTYFLNGEVSADSANIAFVSAEMPTTIKAVSAYL